jgi:hypothetical protein
MNYSICFSEQQTKIGTEIYTFRGPVSFWRGRGMSQIVENLLGWGYDNGNAIRKAEN